MKLSDKADRLAAIWKGEREPEWFDLRDWVDQVMMDDLDCQSLEILTDMVAARIKSNLPRSALTFTA